MYVLLRSNVKNAHVYKFKLPAKKFKSRTLWLFGDSILNFSFLLPSVELVGMNFVSLLEHTVCFRACHPSLKLSTRGKAAICLQANCLWFMQLKCCLRIHCSSQTSKICMTHSFSQIAQLLYWIESKPFVTKNGGVAQLLRLFLTEHSLFLQLYKLSSSLCTSDVTKQT